MAAGTSDQQIGIVGGGIAGLTAAHNFEQAGYRKIRLYDENNYQGERRSAWGELVRNFESLPLSKDCDGYRRHVKKGLFISESGRTETKLADGAVIDRGTIEKEMMKSLNHAEVFEDERINKQKFFEISEKNDLIIDATGSFPISQYFVPIRKKNVRTTVSCRLEGDFSHIMTPRAVSYKNYFVWINPQSTSEATVGIGCETKNSPGELYDDMSRILRERNIEPPSEEETYFGTVASSSLLSLAKSEYTLNGSKVYLVGDSLGITNGITGFGINKSVESAELAVKCHQNGRSYSRKLTRSQITRSLKLNVLDKARRLFSLAKLQTAFPSKFRYNRLLEISVE